MSKDDDKMKQGISMLPMLDNLKYARAEGLGALANDPALASMIRENELRATRIRAMGPEAEEFRAAGAALADAMGRSLQAYEAWKAGTGTREAFEAAAKERGRLAQKANKALDKLQRS